MGACSEVISGTYSIKQTGADDPWCSKETARHNPSHVLHKHTHFIQEQSKVPPPPIIIHSSSVQYTASASVHRYSQTLPNFKSLSFPFLTFPSSLSQIPYISLSISEISSLTFPSSLSQISSLTLPFLHLSYFFFFFSPP